MSTLKIITSKAAIEKAISGYSSHVATFSEKTHSLAVSAINFDLQSKKADMIQLLYNATPVNYRLALQKWATHFGRCSFDSKSRQFAFVGKGGRSDIEASKLVSPADFAKTAAKARDTSKVTLLIDRVAKMIKPWTEAETGEQLDIDRAFATWLELKLEAFQKTNAEAIKKATTNIVKLAQPEESTPSANAPAIDTEAAKLAAKAKAAEGRAAAKAAKEAAKLAKPEAAPEAPEAAPVARKPRGNGATAPEAHDRFAA